MPADVILLTGPPGSGKTTTARSVAATFSRSVHLHTDDFWHVIVSGGVLPYLPEADGQNQTVMAAIRSVAWQYAAGGFTTVVDGIIGPWMLPHFRGTDVGPEAAATRTAVTGVAAPRLHYVVLRPSRDETLRRAQARTSPGALVDEVPVTEMWDQFSDLAELEPHVLDTTAQSPEETLAAVERAVASESFLLSRG